ncbi:hypothetical protein [Loigolactobacillus binensis]|uniref:Uncharacterized protein n=1 Tax=Loigolactobacillus binensis TaxID=2559922 RepID=A0ABW3E9Y7_9LACO|nr:hypothetical protein [Loigolactobacillus binensis]
MKQIAGTIMLIDTQDEPKFLVTKTAARYRLFLTEQTAGQTPLATILTAFKDQLGVDVTSLRLGELSNVVIRGQDVSLFVFEWGKLTPKQLAVETAALQKQGYTFEYPQTLQGMLAQIDMSGVPRFN